MNLSYIILPATELRCITVGFFACHLQSLQRRLTVAEANGNWKEQDALRPAIALARARERNERRDWEGAMGEQA